MPHAASGLASPSTLLQPVPGGSMNTRSAMSSGQRPLSTTGCGPAPASSASGSMTRRGPMTPMCSHSEAEPGPPLKQNRTGREAGSSVSAR